MASIAEQAKQAAALRDARILWARRHYGVLSEVARETGYSTPLVRLVFYGSSQNAVVERAFAQRGAPGFVAPAA
jgi:hypothetical protein